MYYTYYMESMLKYKSHIEMYVNITYLPLVCSVYTIFFFFFSIFIIYIRILYNVETYTENKVGVEFFFFCIILTENFVYTTKIGLVV